MSCSKDQLKRSLEGLEKMIVSTEAKSSIKILFLQIRVIFWPLILKSGLVPSMRPVKEAILRFARCC